MSADAQTDAAGDPPAYRAEVVAAVRERLLALDGVEDRAFTGPPIAGLPLQPLELGELWPDFELSQEAWNARQNVVDSLRRLSADASIESAAGSA